MAPYQRDLVRTVRELAAAGRAVTEPRTPDPLESRGYGSSTWRQDAFLAAHDAMIASAFRLDGKCAAAEG